MLQQKVLFPRQQLQTQVLQLPRQTPRLRLPQGLRFGK